MSIFWEILSGYVVFSASWFNSGYMLFPVNGGFCTRILRSTLVLLFCVCREENRIIGFLGALVLLVSTDFALCSLLLFPFTAQCLVLSGTCYAPELGWLLEEFRDFLRDRVHSAPEVDSRASSLAVKIPQVQFLVMLLTCPLLCMSRSSTSLSWHGGRFPWSSAADHCDSPIAAHCKVVDVSLVQVQQIPGTVCV